MVKRGTPTRPCCCESLYPDEICCEQCGEGEHTACTFETRGKARDLFGNLKGSP